MSASEVEGNRGIEDRRDSSFMNEWIGRMAFRWNGCGAFRWNGAVRLEAGSCRGVSAWLWSHRLMRPHLVNVVMSFSGNDGRLLRRIGASGVPMERDLALRVVWC